MRVALYGIDSLESHSHGISRVRANGDLKTQAARQYQQPLRIGQSCRCVIYGTSASRDGLAVSLRLSGDSTRILAEVWDADPQPPVLKPLGDDGLPDPGEEGGRGLFLVAMLSSRWNWYPTQDPPGKVVWCEMEAAGSARQALLRRLRDCLRNL